MGVSADQPQALDPAVESSDLLDNNLAVGGAGRGWRACCSTRGLLAKRPSTNLFIVVEGTFLTPPLSAGILPGITRAVVIESWPASACRATRGRCSSTPCSPPTRRS